MLHSTKIGIVNIVIACLILNLHYMSICIIHTIYKDEYEIKPVHIVALLCKISVNIC